MPPSAAEPNTRHFLPDVVSIRVVEQVDSVHLVTSTEVLQGRLFRQA
jgi:hypothetical protein